MNMGGTWVIYDFKTASTSAVDVSKLTDGLPNGTKVVEIRPSPAIPKQVAVVIEIPGSAPMRWVMVWDRQSGAVSRVSPVGANCDQVDWSRDGRYVLFMATEIESKRVTFQAVKPTGGENSVVAVVKEAGT